VYTADNQMLEGVGKDIVNGWIKLRPILQDSNPRQAADWDELAHAAAFHVADGKGATDQVSQQRFALPRGLDQPHTTLIL
jgi:hypothetical protein